MALMKVDLSRITPLTGDPCRQLLAECKRLHIICRISTGVRADALYDTVVTIDGRICGQVIGATGVISRQNAAVAAICAIMSVQTAAPSLGRDIAYRIFTTSVTDESFAFLSRLKYVNTPPPLGVLPEHSWRALLDWTIAAGLSPVKYASTHAGHTHVGAISATAFSCGLVLFAVVRPTMVDAEQAAACGAIATLHAWNLALRTEGFSYFTAGTVFPDGGRNLKYLKDMPSDDDARTMLTEHKSVVVGVSPDTLEIDGVCVTHDRASKLASSLGGNVFWRVWTVYTPRDIVHGELFAEGARAASCVPAGKWPDSRPVVLFLWEQAAPPV